MNLNKNISIWRGDSTPPTNYHFWIKSNGQQFIFNGEKWVNYVEEQIDNKLKDYVTKDYLRNEVDKNTINWLNI